MSRKKKPPTLVGKARPGAGPAAGRVGTARGMRERYRPLKIAARGSELIGQEDGHVDAMTWVAREKWRSKTGSWRQVRR